MKKLGKLSINPEKIIKNEELVNLRGGYASGGICCCCGSGGCNYLYFVLPTFNLDEAFDMLYDICGDYNGSCNMEVNCDLIV